VALGSPGLGRERGRERKGALGATAQQLANRARESEREEKREGEGTGTDRSAPLGSERERGAWERELPLTGGVHLSGGAGTRARGLAGPSWAGLGCFLLFFFSGFSNSFSIYFL
jgi:hypothetical protein